MKSGSRTWKEIVLWERAIAGAWETEEWMKDLVPLQQIYE